MSGERLNSVEEAREAVLVAVGAALEEEVVALKTDPKAVEKIARETLNLVKPGEVVLLLPDGWQTRVKPPGPPAAPAAPAPAPRSPGRFHGQAIAASSFLTSRACTSGETSA